jgi:hypothetical protein
VLALQRYHRRSDAACADLAAFKVLFDTPVDAAGVPTGNAPINDWPRVTI